MNAVLVAIGATLALLPFAAVLAYLVRAEGWKPALGCVAWALALIVWMMAASYLVETGLGG